MANYKSPYSINEEVKIIEYLISHDGIEKIKGNVIWKNMANDIDTNRTWQSLKEHFRRSMTKKLNCSFYNLTLSQKQQIISVYGNKSNINKEATRKKNQSNIPDETETETLFEDDDSSDKSEVFDIST